MDKFVNEAECLKTRLAELDLKSGGFGGARLYQTDKEEYEDVILDVKILLHEFGNKALIDELAKYKRLPNPNDLSYLLGKLIETAKLRSK